MLGRYRQLACARDSAVSYVNIYEAPQGLAGVPGFGVPGVPQQPGTALRRTSEFEDASVAPSEAGVLLQPDSLFLHVVLDFLAEKSVLQKWMVLWIVMVKSKEWNTRTAT